MIRLLGKRTLTGISSMWGSVDPRYPHPPGFAFSGLAVVLFAACLALTTVAMCARGVDAAPAVPYLPHQESLLPESRSDESCRCGPDDLRRLAQAGQERSFAPSEVSDSGDLGERIRRAGEMAAKGDIERAKEIVVQAIWECQSKEGNVRDCARWSAALRGLNSLLENPPKRKVVTNSIGMKLVRIPPGEYMMGSLKSEMDWLRLTFKKIWREGHKQWFQDELPLHPVRITKPFYIGSTEVTVAQFREFVTATKYKTDAERGEGGMIFSKQDNRWVPRKNMKWNVTPWKLADDQPVVFVSWNDAKAFCSWLSRKEKRTYRLPTEAEWEMACRGGMVWSRFPWGNRLPGRNDTNFGDGDPKLPESLTTVDDGYQYVAPVGSFPPNGFGLHDMDGNVMEWVQDLYGRNYYETSPLEDPQGPPGSEGSRVNKGGNWYASPADGRCAFRGFSGPEMNFFNLGFRVVMEDPDHEERVRVANRDRDRSAPDSGQADAQDLPPTEEDGLRYFRQAMFAGQQQQWDEAVSDLEKALKVYEKRQDYLWVARVKATLAGIFAEQNRPFKSKELYTQALADFRSVGDASSALILLARLQELNTSPVVRVVKVQKGSNAEKAGIVAGDLIIEYAGDTGFRSDAFKRLVREHSSAEKVTLSAMNENDEITTVMVPGGPLGVAVEDIRRRPRRPPPAQQERPRRNQRRDRRGRR